MRARRRVRGLGCTDQVSPVRPIAAGPEEGQGPWREGAKRGDRANTQKTKTKKQKTKTHKKSKSQKVKKGKARPKTERSQEARDGIPTLTAPHDAEAETSQLSAKGLERDRRHPSGTEDLAPGTTDQLKKRHHIKGYCARWPDDGGWSGTELVSREVGVGESSDSGPVSRCRSRTAPAPERGAPHRAEASPDEHPRRRR